MSILSSLKHTVARAIERTVKPAAEDVGVLKLLELKASSPVRDRSGSKKKVNKTKNRAKAKAAAKARRK